jgi:hypothetical protein
MSTHSRAALFGAIALFVVASASAHAMGVAHGRTKIDFQAAAGDTTSGRLFAKLDVTNAVTSNGNPFFGTGGGHGKKGRGGSNNFALAGDTVTLMIGSASISGTADDKGRVSTPFTAKLTANGKILQIMANGLDLQDLFPLDTTDGEHQVTVALKVTATTTATVSGVAITTVGTLSDQNVTFFYSTKNGKIRGKNF